MVLFDTVYSNTVVLCRVFNITCIYDYRNALNVVKDDLIGQVDDLTGSLELLRAELQTIKTQKESVSEKVNELEDELKEVCMISSVG